MTTVDNRRILVANQPRAYREVIAETFRALLPTSEVITAQPEEMDEAILQLEPQVVLCSQLTEAVETRPLAWILLYPEGAALAVMSIAGQQSTIDDVDFDSILTMVERVQRDLSSRRPVLPLG